jgi:hypothetical protein
MEGTNAMTYREILNEAVSSLNESQVVDTPGGFMLRNEKFWREVKSKKSTSEGMRVSTWTRDNLLQAVPALEVKAINPLGLFRKDTPSGGDSEYRMLSLLFSDDFIGTLKTESGEFINIEQEFRDMMRDAYANRDTHWSIIAFGMGGGRVTHANNGSVIFGVGKDPLMIFHDLNESQNHSWDFDIQYKGEWVGIEASRLIQAEVDDFYGNWSLRNIARGILPRAVSLIKAGRTRGQVGIQHQTI